MENSNKKGKADIENSQPVAGGERKETNLSESEYGRINVELHEEFYINSADVKPFMKALVDFVAEWKV